MKTDGLQEIFGKKKKLRPGTAGKTRRRISTRDDGIKRVIPRKANARRGSCLLRRIAETGGIPEKMYCNKSPSSSFLPDSDGKFPNAFG